MAVINNCLKVRKDIGDYMHWIARFTEVSGKEWEAMIHIQPPTRES
jgi:hypothetical protein